MQSYSYYISYSLFHHHDDNDEKKKVNSMKINGLCKKTTCIYIYIKYKTRLDNNLKISASCTAIYDYSI